MSGHKCRISESALSSSDVAFLLYEWGRWARQRSGVRIGYSSPRTDPDAHLYGPRDPYITDVTAAWVDQCVAQVTPQRARDALVMRFVVNASQRRSCRELGCAPATFQSLVDAGVHQVGDALAG